MFLPDGEIEDSFWSDDYEAGDWALVVNAENCLTSAFRRMTMANS